VGETLLGRGKFLNDNRITTPAVKGAGGQGLKYTKGVYMYSSNPC